jgi:hypothetical protein
MSCAEWSATRQKQKPDSNGLTPPAGVSYIKNPRQKQIPQDYPHKARISG